jgi:hypothetical protein
MDIVDGKWWMKTPLYDLSPFVNSFENMAIFLFFFFLFFSWTFMYPISLCLMLGPSCVHVFFFLIAYVSIVTLYGERERERPTHIVELLFCGIKWMVQC